MTTGTDRPGRFAGRVGLTTRGRCWPGGSAIVASMRAACRRNGSRPVRRRRTSRPLSISPVEGRAWRHSNGAVRWRESSPSAAVPGSSWWPAGSKPTRSSRLPLKTAWPRTPGFSARAAMRARRCSAADPSTKTWWPASSSWRGAVSVFRSRRTRQCRRHSRSDRILLGGVRLADVGAFEALERPRVSETVTARHVSFLVPRRRESPPDPDLSGVPTRRAR